jgi:GNAT superfamily N-acetyltransferase
MKALELRLFSAADYDTWYPLWRGYQAFYRVDIADSVSRTTWQRLLDPSEPMQGCFAFAEGEAVGIVHYIEHRSCWTTGNYLYLQDLFVAASTRGRGVGRALIEHVYGEAVARGCARVYWLTHETNREAMQLYDRIADRSGFLQYRKLFGS